MEYLKCVMKILLQRHIVPTCGMKLLKPLRIMRPALRQLSNGVGDGTSYVLVDGVSVVQWHA